MNRTKRFLTAAAMLVAALALGACGKQQEQAPPAAPAAQATAPAAPAPMPAVMPVRVVAVDLGSAIGADMKITTPKTTFAPGDTIYASVSTEGSAPSAKLHAKWSYQDGQTVNESDTTIQPSGPAVTAFHISKPDGFPEGHYKIDISLDGVPAISKDFDVKK
ncbi:MAG TPA: hypothetical protein VF216_03150 [Mizugakiibacter sp.]